MLGEGFACISSVVASGSIGAETIIVSFRVERKDANMGELSDLTSSATHW